MTGINTGINFLGNEIQFKNIPRDLSVRDATPYQLYRNSDLGRNPEEYKALPLISRAIIQMNNPKVKGSLSILYGSVYATSALVSLSAFSSLIAAGVFTTSMLVPLVPLAIGLGMIGYGVYKIIDSMDNSYPKL